MLYYYTTLKNLRFTINLEVCQELVYGFANHKKLALLGINWYRLPLAYKKDTNSLHTNIFFQLFCQIAFQSFFPSYIIYFVKLTKFQLLYFSSLCYSSSFFFIEAPTLSCQDGIGHIITINTNPFVVPHHHREGRCDVYILHIGTI